MTQFLTALSIWLHSIATLIFIGHYLLLSLVYLPAFAKHPAEPSNGLLLSEISRGSRKWLYIALVIFILTGFYLMLVNPFYFGIGQFTNAWSFLMLAKHVLILGMVGIGFWFNAILRVGPLMSSNSGAAAAQKRFSQYSWLMTVTGLLVLLLTAASQVT